MTSTSTTARRNKKNGRYYRPGINRPMPIKDDSQCPTFVVHLLENNPPVDRPAPADEPQQSSAEPMPDRVIQALAGISVALIVLSLFMLFGGAR